MAKWLRQHNNMNDKYIIKTAKTLSTLFSPLYAPIWVIIGLFEFSYMQMLPLAYKVFMLGLTFLFTVLIPHMGISWVRVLKKWTHWQMSHREHRHLPYVVTLLSYSTCLVIMTHLNVAMFFRGIIMAALVAQVVCVLINTHWKISTHMVGMGGLTGALNAFSILFFYNPVWPFCALLLLSGALGTSRMILRQHSLAQVLVGYAVGYVCALAFILLSWL